MPGVNGNYRSMSGKASPSSQILKSYNMEHGRGMPTNNGSGNNYSMPQMAGVAAAGVRRFPQF